MSKEKLKAALNSARPKKGGAGVMISTNLGTFLTALDAKLIIPYEYNRGMVGINRQTIKKIKCNFHLPSLGSFVITKGETGYVQLDGHTRTKALQELFDEGKFCEYDMEADFHLCLVHPDDKLLIYSNLNAGVKHNSAAKLTNPDFAGGKLMERLDDLVGRNTPNRLVVNVSSTLMALDETYKLGTDITLDKIYKAKTKLSRIRDEEAAKSGVKISKKAYADLAEALKYYHTLSDTLLSKTPKQDGNKGDHPLKTITKSAGLPLFTLIDYLNYKKVSKMDPERVAELVLGSKRLQKEVVDAVGLIARRKGAKNAHVVTLAERITDRAAVVASLAKKKK